MYYFLDAFILIMLFIVFPYMDLKSRIIANKHIMLILFALALSLHDVNFNFFLFVFVFVFSFLSFSFNVLGAGDVKLISVLSLFIEKSQEGVFMLIFSMTTLFFIVFLFFMKALAKSGFFYECYRRVPFGVPISISYGLYRVFLN